MRARIVEGGLQPAADRIHIATKESVLVPGGLHSVVQELAAAQAGLGKTVAIVDNIKSARKLSVTIDGMACDEALPVATDAVYEYHFPQTVYTGLAYSRRDTRRLFHFHGPWSVEGRYQGNGRLRTFLKWLIEYGSYRQFDAFITASAAFSDLLRVRYGVSQEKIHVVYPGVDANIYSPGLKSEARQKLGIDESHFLFGSLRRLEPRMGLDLAIRAIHGVADAHLAIAGDGSFRTALQGLVEELGVTDRVSFIGPLSQADKVWFYRALDVAIVPSIALEGFGLVVLEAMACGTPVIASRLGGLPEAMGPWAEEYCFAPSSVEDLRRAVTASISAPLPAVSSLRAYCQTMTWTETARNVERVIATLD